MTNDIQLKEFQSFLTEKDYRKSKCLSYSVLKNVDENPKVLIEKPDTARKKHFVLGSLVDVLVTEEDYFPDKFYISDAELPSDSIMKIIDEIYKRKVNLLDEKFEKKVVNITREFNYRDNFLDKTLYANIKKEGTAYFELLSKAENKTIISSSTYIFGEKMARAIQLKKEKYVYNKQPLTEVLYQFKIKFIYEGVKCKAMFDIVLIDHFTRTITPIDIKTGSVHPKEFPTQFIKYKYWLQAAHYTTGLQYVVVKANKKCGTAYTLKPFQFIYISTLTPEFPVTFEVSSEWHARGVNGYIDGVTLRKTKGLKELVKDAFWYLESNAFGISKELMIDDDKVIVLHPPTLFWEPNFHSNRLYNI